MPVDAHRPARRPLERAEHVEQRRLARAGRPTIASSSPRSTGARRRGGRRRPLRSASRGRLPRAPALIRRPRPSRRDDPLARDLDVPVGKRAGLDRGERASPPRLTSSTASPPPRRARIASTGTASTFFARSRSSETTTGAPSRPSRLAGCASRTTTDTVGVEGSPCAVVATSATFPTECDPPGDDPAGRELDPHGRADARELLLRRVEVDLHDGCRAGDLQHRLPRLELRAHGRLELADPPRPRQEDGVADLDRPVFGTSRASCHERTAAAVSASNVLVDRHPIGSWPSSTRFRSSCSTSAPSATPRRAGATAASSRREPDALRVDVVQRRARE